ncbi:hypothetical protein NDU88_005232 [Pleurodeles waltl]|uniref:Uncharacterized protein n=1 Tax=Pleurodeles waltl TaxID=8319 RepID=A0AAV7WU70_PLEWA|nr:hypothetical protein NDU88_005232 [Pleurodeles waltl]
MSVVLERHLTKTLKEIPPPEEALRLKWVSGVCVRSRVSATPAGPASKLTGLDFIVAAAPTSPLKGDTPTFTGHFHLSSKGLSGLAQLGERRGSRPSAQYGFLFFNSLTAPNGRPTVPAAWPY